MQHPALGQGCIVPPRSMHANIAAHCCLYAPSAVQSVSLPPLAATSQPHSWHLPCIHVSDNGRLYVRPPPVAATGAAATPVAAAVAATVRQPQQLAPTALRAAVGGNFFSMSDLVHAAEANDTQQPTHMLHRYAFRRASAPFSSWRATSRPHVRQSSLQHVCVQCVAGTELASIPAHHAHRS